jgi:hypothetical protein
LFPTEDFDVYIDVISFYKTGSREICNPPPMDTDEDWCVKVNPEVDLGNAQVPSVEQNLKGLIDQLFESGYKINGDYPDSDSISFKKDEINIILHKTDLSYNLWYVATQVAKKLNLINKEDRIMLFNAIIGGEYDGFQAQPQPVVEEIPF